MVDLVPKILLYNDEDIEIYGNKEYSNVFINRLVNTFNNRKQTILNFFDINNIDKIRINLFDKKQILINYLNKFFNVSSYCVGAVCDGAICYYIDDEALEDIAKARIYDCINYS